MRSLLELEQSPLLRVNTYTCKKNLINHLLQMSSFLLSVKKWSATSLQDWLRKFAPLFHPIRRKTKTNRDSLKHVFPRSTSATCIHSRFWLVHWIVRILCDWSDQSDRQAAWPSVLGARFEIRKSPVQVPFWLLRWGCFSVDPSSTPQSCSHIAN